MVRFPRPAGMRALRASTTTLHLPPGHRLLAAWGADDSPDAWLDRWQLLDLFLLMLVTAAAYRLLGWRRRGRVAGLGILLTYHEPGAPSWLWINAIIAIAIMRVVPEGRCPDLVRAVPHGRARRARRSCSFHSRSRSIDWRCIRNCRWNVASRVDERWRQGRTGRLEIRIADD